MSVAALASFSAVFSAAGIAGIVIASTQPQWFNDGSNIGSWNGWRVIVMFASVASLVVGLTLGMLAYAQANYKMQLGKYRDVQLETKQSQSLDSIFKSLGVAFAQSRDKAQPTRFTIYYTP